MWKKEDEETSGLLFDVKEKGFDPNIPCFFSASK